VNRIVVGFVLALVALAAALAAFVWTGTYDVAASAREVAPVRWLFATARDHSIEARSGTAQRPAELGDDRMARGAEEYGEMCVVCHGAPGRPPSAIRQGLNPPAPDLGDEDVQRRYSDAELFWIVKHGIRMTGMPAFGATHDEPTIWDIVAFLRRLPSLDAEGYAALTRARGEGHSH
jgi:mono/diheme cytochrome c family protein